MMELSEEDKLKAQLEQMMKDYWNKNLANELKLDKFNMQRVLDRFDSIKEKNLDKIITQITKLKQKGFFNAGVRFCLICHKPVKAMQANVLCERRKREDNQTYQNYVLYYFHSECIMNLLSKYIQEQSLEVSK